MTRVPANLQLTTAMSAIARCEADGVPATFRRVCKVFYDAHELSEGALLKRLDELTRRGLVEKVDNSAEGVGRVAYRLTLTALPPASIVREITVRELAGNELTADESDTLIGLINNEKRVGKFGWTRILLRRGRKEPEQAYKSLAAQGFIRLSGNVLGNWHAQVSDKGREAAR